MAYRVKDGTGSDLWLGSQGGAGASSGDPMLPQSAFSQEILAALLPQSNETQVAATLSPGSTLVLAAATGRYRLLNLYVMPDPTTDTTVTIESSAVVQWTQKFDDTVVGYNGPLLIQMEPQGDLTCIVTGSEDVNILVNYYEVL